MINSTIFTWIIAIWGSLIFLILLISQFVMLLKPRSQKAQDILIGKGEEWRDETHFKSAYAFAWADWIVVMPLIVTGNIGVLSGHSWGYIIWITLGVISIYFSVLFWVMEKEYTYPSIGAFAYYTYFWGFYLYWGIASVIYSILRFQDLMI